MKEMKDFYEAGYTLVEDYGWEEVTYSINDEDAWTWEEVNHWSLDDKEVRDIVINHEIREIRVIFYS